MTCLLFLSWLYKLCYGAIKWVRLLYSRIEAQNHDVPNILSNRNYPFFFWLSSICSLTAHQLTKSMAASMTQKLLTPTISISHQNNQLFTISLFKRSHASQRTLTKLALDSSCCTANQFNMAATTNDFSKNSVNLTLLLLAIIISSIHHLPVHSLEFQVGGNRGWVVPPANDSKIYNDWASENRFQVGDTIRESQATRELTYFILLVYFPFSFWSNVHVCVQASSTRRTQWWRWQTRNTRSAIPRTLSSSPTQATQRSGSITLGLFTSSVEHLATARRVSEWSSKSCTTKSPPPVLVMIMATNPLLLQPLSWLLQFLSWPLFSFCCCFVLLLLISTRLIVMLLFLL